MKKSNCKPPTRAEMEWIKRFKRLASSCPKSLWLFSASGRLHVMKTPEDGNEMGNSYDGCGVNPDNSIDTIDIRNDGGDW